MQKYIQSRGPFTDSYEKQHKLLPVDFMRNPSFRHKVLDLFNKCTTKDFNEKPIEYFRKCCNINNPSQLRQSRCTYLQNSFDSEYDLSGGKKNKSKTRKQKRGARKWSLKYKKSIHCNQPHGFSQKQYCKYGRRKF